MATINPLTNISEILKLDDHLRYLSHTQKHLTAAGENYGSLMLLVELKVQNLEKNCEESFSVVAKTLPPNEFLRTVFNVNNTFVNELHFYKYIVPSYEEFVKRQTANTNLVDIFPKYYGGRLSLNGENVGDDAIIFLENLNISGFKCLDRFEGLNLECTELVLKKLAAYHAIPLAMRLLEPEAFAKAFAYSKRRNMVDSFDDFMETAVDRLKLTLDHDDYCLSLFPKLAIYCRNIIPNMALSRKTSDKFTSVVHKDMWINNFMVKLVDNKPVACKFVDFQLYELGSLTADLFFLIFSSVNMTVIEQNYDHLIELYYEHFIENLNNLKCDTSIYTYDEFLKEIDADARYGESVHSILMANPILAKKGTVKDLNEIDASHMSRQEINEMHREKITFLVRMFDKRNWLQQ